MGLSEKQMVKPALADDFYAWYAEYKSTWKPQVNSHRVASSARQATQLPSLTPTSSVAQVSSGVASTASQFNQVPSLELLATEKLAPLKSSSYSFCKPGAPISPSISPSSSFSFSAAPAPSNSPSTPAIFTTEYFEARPSPKGGIGAFASKSILEGTVILAEEPLMLANIMEVYHSYDNLSIEKRKMFRSLYGWPGVNPEPTMAIFQTNRFEIEGKGGIFYKTSRFNHACHPAATCTYRWNLRERKLITTALRDIEPGQEITISYGSAGSLFQNYGFHCDCEYCPHPEEAAKEAKRLRGTGDWIYWENPLWR